MQSKPKYLLVLALSLIALVFMGAATVAYQQFSADVFKNELASQQKMTRIINQSMTRYFETLKFVAENTVLQASFRPERNKKEDAIRFEKISPERAQLQISSNGISKILSSPRSALPQLKVSSPIENWKLFKGLPETSRDGSLVAKERRTIARNVLKSFHDIHYVFEMDLNGDLVFLEPFEIQKNVTSFNYEFRDYLRLVQTTRATAISEGYISHDQNRTQIITIATPVFDVSGKVAKLFAVSVSATTLRERVFRSLKENLDLRDGTTFYLVDRHGHIVASSSGKGIYFPTEGQNEDGADLGNLRSTGFFKNIDWTPDVLEKGNIWERNTMSWVVSSLNKDYSGEYKNIAGIDVFATLFPTAIIGSESANWGILIETPIDQILASKTYLKRVFYLASLVLVAILFSLSVIILRHFSQLEAQIDKKQTELEQIASQVAHDIRSPLAALNAIEGESLELPEDTRLLLRTAIARIKDIANSLLERYKKSNLQASNKTSDPVDEKSTLHLLSALVDPLITEKRFQFRSKVSVEIHFNNQASAYGLFVNIQPIEFKRVLSNLINNAVEAIEGQGRVEISIEKIAKQLVISVKDDGKGIPSEILRTLGQRGVTYDKKDGLGLGLHHAMKSIKTWSGKLELKSEPGKGTTAMIYLPIANAPDWFVAKLDLAQGQPIAILDDDASVHRVWQSRFESTFEDTKRVQLHHFSTSSDIDQWIAKSKGVEDTVYLVDYELIGEATNGLDLIERHGIASASVLVTSRYEDPTVLSRCRKLGVKLIPKGLAGFVPIVVANS